MAGAGNIAQQLARAINNDRMRHCMSEVLGPSIPLPTLDNEPPWFPHPPTRGYEPLRWRLIPPRHYMLIETVLRVMFEGTMDNVDPYMFNELHRKFIQNAYYHMYIEDLLGERWRWWRREQRVGWRKGVRICGLKVVVNLMFAQDWYEAKCRDFMWFWAWRLWP